MFRRYRVRWSLLALMIGVFVVVPLVASVLFDLDLWPIAVASLAVFAIGAGSAGLRARGSVTQTLHYDPDRDPAREVDWEFTRPRDEENRL
jgi:hypothetical protein